jgi:hypothetical protein
LIPYGLFDWAYGRDIRGEPIHLASIGAGLRFCYSRLSGGATLAKIIHPSRFQGCPFQLKFNALLKIF